MIVIEIETKIHWAKDDTPVGTMLAVSIDTDPRRRYILNMIF